MSDTCIWFSIKEIGNSRVRIWDILILIPNIIFLIFLLFGLKHAWTKINISIMPVITTFYFLIWLSVILNILRCLVYMTLSAKNPVEDTIDKLLWVILKFFLLTIELSVLIFALAFSKLDSKKSVRYVLIFASTVSLVYSSVQGYLELKYPDPSFNIKSKDFNLFSYGGLKFLSVTSFMFGIGYTCVVILPKTSMKHKLSLPTKKSFYHYCLYIAILNLIIGISAILMINHINYSLCFIYIGTYLYLTTYAPIVYATFLKGIFRITHGNLFGYKPQINEASNSIGRWHVAIQNSPTINYNSRANLTNKLPQGSLKTILHDKQDDVDNNFAITLPLSESVTAPSVTSNHIQHNLSNIGEMENFGIRN